MYLPCYPHPPLAQRPPPLAPPMGPEDQVGRRTIPHTFSFVVKLTLQVFCGPPGPLCRRAWVDRTEHNMHIWAVGRGRDFSWSEQRDSRKDVFVNRILFIEVAETLELVAQIKRSKMFIIWEETLYLRGCTGFGESTLIEGRGLPPPLPVLNPPNTYNIPAPPMQLETGSQVRLRVRKPNQTVPVDPHNTPTQSQHDGLL